MGGEGHIDHAIYQHETGPVVLPKRMEEKDAAAAAVARTWNRRSDHDRTAEPLRFGPDIQRMQPLHVVAALLRLAQYVEGAGRRVDDRRTGDSDLWIDIL